MSSSDKKYIVYLYTFPNGKKYCGQTSRTIEERKRSGYYYYIGAAIEKYGYDNKQLHHILRCEEFLKRYINGVPYAECLIPTRPKDLIEVKASYIYSKDEAVEIADNIVEIVKDVKQKYMDTHKPIINKVAEKVMNDVLVNVLKKNFMMEMENKND